MIALGNSSPATDVSTVGVAALSIERMIPLVNSSPATDVSTVGVAALSIDLMIFYKDVDIQFSAHDAFLQKP